MDGQTPDRCFMLSGKVYFSSRPILKAGATTERCATDHYAQQRCQSTNSHDRKLPELSPEVLCRDTAMPGLARETESESSRSADGDTSQVSVVRDWQRAPCQPGAHWH